MIKLINDLSSTGHFLYLANKDNSVKNLVAIHMSIISTISTDPPLFDEVNK